VPGDRERARAAVEALVDAEPAAVAG
jgi:hypothetical protein